MSLKKRIAFHPFSRPNFKAKAGLRFKLDGVTYVLGGKLGDGAVGIVRKATSSHNNEVAVKFLAPDPKYIEAAAFDDVSARFRHEGKRGAKLEHDRLVKILGYSDNIDGESFLKQAPDNPFIVMERVHGRTLENHIRMTNPSDVGVIQFDRDSLFIAIQIADALQYIHKKKLIHRDVKPANVFLSGRTHRNDLHKIKLGDFGIVKWGDFHRAVATGTLTLTHQQGLGTLKYMSPEQAIRPKDVTIKTDIFSFGVTLYELFTHEILASPHHVFQIMNARLIRGNSFSRFLELGRNLPYQYEYFGGKLLDCFLRGVANRPKISDLLGCLSALYAQQFNEDWTDEFR